MSNLNNLIKQLANETLTAEEREELKKFRMEYFKELMKKNLDSIDYKCESEAIIQKCESETVMQKAKPFVKVYLYIPKSFKEKIARTKSIGTPVTSIIKYKIERFFNTYTNNSNNIVEGLLNDYLKALELLIGESKENIACNIEIDNHNEIKRLSQEFKVRPRWIIESILFKDFNQSIGD